MKKPLFANVALSVLTILAISQLLWTSSVTQDFDHMKDSVHVLNLVVDSLRAQVPGLGDYMTTIQLHVAKLWFAGQASNWKLAKYELDELAEAMEAAESLHAKRKDVDISVVLRSVRLAQIPLLEQSLEKKNHHAFGDAYDQTLAACNGCHRPAGYEFIHIVTPNREPVTNQRWNVYGQ